MVLKYLLRPLLSINCDFMSIILSGVSFHYYNQLPLFEHINLSVASGDKVSLIGNNGMGKSTLLKLIAGELNLTSGNIRCTSKPYYIPQQIGITGLTLGEALDVSCKINALHAIYNGSDNYEYYEVLADDWDIETRCHNALQAWGLSEMKLTTSIDTLSGGEKTKLLLAGMQIHHPSIILLDEPTNHLDNISRQLLYEFISKSKATILVVSHDITLLNLLEATYEISPKGITLYGGNYNFYKVQKEAEIQALHKQINAEESVLKLARKKAREVNERQEKRAQQGERNKDQIIPILRKTTKNSGEKTSAKLKEKQTDIINQRQQKLSELRQRQPAECELKLNFNNTQLHNGKLLVSANSINFKYEAKNDLWDHPLEIQIYSGERIHLKGDNGSGKTTLIKLLIGELNPDIGEITRNDFSFIYLDQEYNKVKAPLTLLELAQHYNKHNLLDHEIKLRLHRALFSKEMWDKPCNVLSGGERMRLYLCCLMISDQIPDLIILDEPTNNLDLSSLAILATTIKNYRGTLLVISHDRSFINEIGINKTIELTKPNR